MNIFLGIVVGLLCLMFLIVAHEFGHFLAARRSGVRVKEFGVGFPPRLVGWVREKPARGEKKGRWKKLPRSEWKKQQSSLIISLNTLPIGGFCSMDGESDDDPRAGTFGSATFWQKTKILFAGVAMNWLVAFLILTGLALFGIPTFFTNQFSIKSDETVLIDEPVSVEEILEGSPAALAGFKSGDILVSVSTSSETPETITVTSASDVVVFNSAHAGETVTYAINRARTDVQCPDCYESLSLTATLNPSDFDYLLGITMNSGSSRLRYTWSAPLVGAGLTVQMTAETYKGLWNLLKNLVTGAARQISTDSSVREAGRDQISEATEGVSGIVGIIGGYFPGIVSAGPTYVFSLIAIISISLACMNVLPIPALDGGRWTMIFFVRLRRKKLSKETEQKIVARAFIFLLILMAVITVVDIIRLF